MVPQSSGIRLIHFYEMRDHGSEMHSPRYREFHRHNCIVVANRTVEIIKFLNFLALVDVV